MDRVDIEQTEDRAPKGPQGNEAVEDGGFANRA